MKLRKLAKSDLSVSEMAFGCWAITGDRLWGKQDENESIASLRTAYDRGINFFDTAEGYGGGYSEQLLAKALDHERDSIVIATKVSPHHFTLDGLKRACEQSLRYLRTDYIDLYQLHWANHDLAMSEPVRALAELQQEGKIRYFGVSNFGPEDMSEFLSESTALCSNQLAYNLLFRCIEFEISPFCEENEISILSYSSLMQGLLTGKFNSPDDVPEGRARSRHFSNDRPLSRHGEPGCETETFRTIREIRQIASKTGLPMADLAICWLLSRPAVCSVIVGGRNPEQVKQNVKALELNVDQEILDRLTVATDKLKSILGSNADLWQGDSRIR